MKTTEFLLAIRDHPGAQQLLAEIIGKGGVFERKEIFIGICKNCGSLVKDTSDFQFSQCPPGFGCQTAPAITEEREKLFLQHAIDKIGIDGLKAFVEERQNSREA